MGLRSWHSTAANGATPVRSSGVRIAPRSKVGRRSRQVGSRFGSSLPEGIGGPVHRGASHMPMNQIIDARLETVKLPTSGAKASMSQENA